MDGPANPLLPILAPRSPEFERNRQWANQEKDFITRLSDREEAEFANWIKEANVPFDPSERADYDMRGFWKAMKQGDRKAEAAINPHDNKLHFPDYWKTPYHKSFSAESKFATKNAPRWNGKGQLVAKDGTVIYDEAPNDMPMLREPNTSETSYFMSNRKVAGMATEDGRVILNPYSDLSPDEKKAVYMNEASRLHMRKSGVPDFSMTDKQKKFLSGTTYRNALPEDQRATIIGRILSGDPSAQDATPEQKAAAQKVLEAMKAGDK